MKKIGLALSGGGFRASLYHLGLIRFLRDAGILPQVSHITSVSGGSIIGAHLALNWDRYNGSPNDFESVASELLAFVRMDVRNRITRRFPLTMPFRWPRRLMGYSNRMLTRTGLLEYHYRKYLYGDTCLFQLPERPMLHILATNLSEGCLASFNRNGLIMMRRQPGGAFRSQRTEVGLATVPMAVTASSAFPGFFPPIYLTGGDVGTNPGEFGRQAFTDGGVFDNLGVRMFRCLERPLLAENHLSRDDFVDFGALVEAFRSAGKAGDESPLRRLAQILVAPTRRGEPLLVTKSNGAADPAPVTAACAASAPRSGEELLMASLDNVLRHFPLHREAAFADIRPGDSEAEALLRAAGGPGDRVLDLEDQIWLNRHLLEAAYHQATGHACFRRLGSGFDAVFVSDVGKRFEVQESLSAGGLIRTAMRSTDILMDRVWQLENDTFADTSGFVFSRIHDVVELHEDPTALHPEVQRQAANIRTDLDRFSPLEISTLVRHGYCTGRKTCRSHPELFGNDLPTNPPWDPIPEARVGTTASSLRRLEGPKRDAVPVTVESRKLQASALRRIWSTLLDYRDWTSYVYVPILALALLLAPYLILRSYQHSQRLNHLIESLSQGSRDLEIMSQLLDGPMTPWVGEVPEEVAKMEPLDYKGFEVLQDSRILDLRPWNPIAGGKTDPDSLVYGYRRVKILKLRDNTDNEIFRMGALSTHPKAQIRFPTQQLVPKLSMMKTAESLGSEKLRRFEISADFKRVPPGDVVDLIYEHYSPGLFLQRSDNATTLTYPIEVDTAEMTRWFMMPRGHDYKSWRVLEYETGKPGTVEPLKVHTEYLADDNSILAFKLLSVKGGMTHDVEWKYK
jgi:predicted acylesterase/phospholipase RssA